MADYKFTWDFYQGKGSIANLSHILERFGKPSTYIEVGVFEGWTLFSLSDALKHDIRMFAVDPHEGSNDMTDDFTVVKNNFLHNLSICENKRIEYISEYSRRGLIQLINRQVKAELIYIDGDHKAGEVLTDLVLAWELLQVGGVMLCDDTGTWKFQDKNNTFSAQMSPRMAVEMFIQCNWHKLNILPLIDNNQTAFVKIQE